MFKYLLCNALHVFSILLLDDQKTTFYELDSLYALVLLTVATPTLVNTVEGRNFILGHQVKKSLPRLICEMLVCQMYSLFFSTY